MNLSYDEVVRRSNINYSPSKETHKFTQSPRFLQPQPVCTRDSYDLTPLMMSSRIQRKDKDIPQSQRFINRTDLTPSPCTYNQLSSFNLKKIAKNGPCLDQAKRVIFVDTMHIPGPGTYSPKHVSQKHLFMTMSPRSKTRKQKGSLGPGQYSIQKYDAFNVTNLRNNYSKYSNIKQNKIGKEARFNENKTTEAFPGPGQYLNSTKKSNEKGIYSFGREKRSPSFLKQSITPGPGNYKQFSEFADRRKHLIDNLRKMQQMVGNKVVRK